MRSPQYFDTLNKLCSQKAQDYKVVMHTAVYICICIIIGVHMCEEYYFKSKPHKHYMAIFMGRVK